MEIRTKEAKKSVKPRLKSGVKEIVVQKCTTPDFLAGKNDCIPHVVIKSQEDEGFLIARIPKEGFYEGTKESQKCATQWACKAVPPGGPCITSDDACEIQGESIQIRIPRKTCGSALYWLEAFLYSPENKVPNGFFVSGYCKPKITKVTWHEYQEDNKGAELARDVSFGDMLQLHIETEGLNGDVLEVTFTGDEADEPLDVVSGQTFQGRLIINFPVKAIWKSKFFNWLENTLSFDLNITVKIGNERLNTNFSGAELTVKNKIAERKLEKGNAVPVSIGKVEVDAKKYEMCKYTGITVKTEDRELVLFDQNNPVDKMDAIQVVAGSGQYSSEVKVLLTEFSTNPNVYCAKTGGHKGNVFRIESSTGWKKEEKPDEITLDIAYEYPDLGFSTKNTLQILKDYTSNLLVPYSYIWPASKSLAQKGSLTIGTCRYSHELFIEVYPNIKWELIFDIKLDSPLAYEHWNMPAGNIAERNRKIARKTGYNKWYVGKYDKTRFELGVGLGATWNGNEAKLATDFVPKIQSFAEALQKAYEVADKVKKGAGGKINPSKIPVGFEIMSPVVEASISWQMQEVEDDSKIAIEGSLDFKASPLVGAKMIIDLLGVASNLGPPAKIIYASLQTVVDDISEYITFTLEFYGQLDIEFNGLKLNSIRGIDGGETLIKGKMGVKLNLKLEYKGEIKSFGTTIKWGFEAEADAHAYFGGDFKIDADNKGVYIEPVLKFSGLLIKAEITGFFGMYKRTIKLEDAEGNPIEVVDKEEIKFVKKYLIS